MRLPVPVWVVVAVPGALALAAFALLVFTGRTYRFESGRVAGVVGRMGSGKSLFVVSCVLLPVARALVSRRGLYCDHTGRQVQRIVTNFSCNLPFPGVELVALNAGHGPLFSQLVSTDCDHETAADHVRDCYRYRDALVVLDELHMFLPGGRSKIEPDAAYFLSMARKLNCEVWWITQSVMKVHKRLRDDTQDVWTVRRRMSFSSVFTGKPSRRFRAFMYAPELMSQDGTTAKRSVERPLDVRSYRLTPEVLDVYGSFDLIVPDPGTLSAQSAPKSPPVATVPPVAPPGFRPRLVSPPA